MRKTSAFSLIEVSLALGVAAFCLIAIFGLLPVGLTSNQNAVQQTVAAGFASAIVSDLQATPNTSVTTPRYKIPINTGTNTLFLQTDGSNSGSVNQDAVPAQNPLYRATIVIGQQSGRVATPVRIMITWPALADKTWNLDPKNYSGSFETVTYLDRH